MSEVRIAVGDIILERTFEFGLRGDVIIQHPRCGVQLTNVYVRNQTLSQEHSVDAGTNHMIFAQFKQGSHNIFAGTSVAITRPSIHTIGAIEHSSAEESIDLVLSSQRKALRSHDKRRAVVRHQRRSAGETD